MTAAAPSVPAVAESAAPRSGDARISAIDVLRGIAILGVIAHHAFGRWVTAVGPVVPVGGANVSAVILNNGWFGVNLFFLLSGFVLYRPNLLVDGASVLRYYAARAVRLWPLLFIFVTFISVAHGASAAKLVTLLFVYLTGLNAMLPAYFLSPEIVWPLWSLGVEIHFSLLLPLLLIGIRRFGIGPVVVAVVVFALGYRVVADQAWWAQDPGWANPYVGPYKDNILGRIDDFVLGMFAAHLVRVGWAPGRVLVAGALAVLLATMAYWNYEAAPPIARSWGNSVEVSVLHLSAAAAMTVLIVGAARRGGWDHPAWLPLAVCGQLSYSLYLFHGFFFPFLGRQLTAGGIAIFLAVTFVTSLLSFVFIESAGIRRMPGWARRLTVRG